MIRKTILAAILAALCACATPTPDCPREGGIGGTGGCPPSAALE